MFSNRSVSVHPDAPHSEYAGVPDAFSVFASDTSWAHVFGALTPAALKGAKLAAIVDFAYVIGLSFPCSANCFTSPGCAMSAMSGGWPPAIAVASTVGMLLPTGL